MLCIFSNEKNFAKTRVTHRTTGGLLSHPQTCPVMQTNFPVTSIIFGVIRSESDVLPPHFFPERLHPHSEQGSEALGQPCSSNRPYMWHNHTSPDMWPLSLPDCNPLNFFVRGTVEQDIKRSSCNTKDELKDRITRAFRDLCQETMMDFSSPFIVLYTPIKSPISLLYSNVVRPSIHSLYSYDSSLKLGGSFVAVLSILFIFCVCVCVCYS